MKNAISEFCEGAYTALVFMQPVLVWLILMFIILGR